MMRKIGLLLILACVAGVVTGRIQVDEVIGLCKYVLAEINHLLDMFGKVA